MKVSSLADPASLTAGTLRYAINQANFDASQGISDNIVFDASLAGGTILLTQGELELVGAGTGTITIDGSSLTTSLAVSGNNISRVFQVDGGVTAVFNGINIEDAANNNSGFGGGIDNFGNLTVSNATFSGNSASFGAAIANWSTLTVSNSTFSGNSANQYAGAIWAVSGLTVSDSTFTGNSAVNGGGAIETTSCPLTVSGSSFSGNTAAFGAALDNNSGTATVSDTTFSGDVATSGNAIDDNNGTVTLEGQGWTNSETISAENQATLNLYGSWTNTGTITVDGSSTIGLGSPIAVNPTASAAANYAWTNTGTLTIADGATVYLGGIFTTDEFESNLQSFGVSIDLADYTVYVSGTLDNSAADNPTSAGVLALSASTGPLTLAGGEIYHGAATTSGSDALVATASGGTLDGVTLDGTLDMTENDDATVTVQGGLVLNGTIELGGDYNFAELDFGSIDDNTPQAISGTGTIQFGQGQNYFERHELSRKQQQRHAHHRAEHHDPGWARRYHFRQWPDRLPGHHRRCGQRRQLEG